MTRVWGQVGVLVGLIVLLAGTPSWGCGVPAGNDCTDDGGNTGGGDGALIDNTTGGINTAVGAGALFINTIGGNNTAVGSDALRNNTTGPSNTAIGMRALFNNRTGDGNFALGWQALLNNTTGKSNVAMGRGALSNSTGDRNIAVGPQSGSNLTGGSRNLYLGSLGPSSPGAESNTMRLGNPSEQSSAFIAGVFGVVVPGGTAVVIDSSGRLGTSTSSARYKRDIETLGPRSHELVQLRPVSFRYTNDPAGRQQYGLIAEDVATVYPELVTRTATGEVLGVDYPQLIPLLLNELQRQQQAQDRHEQELAALKADHQQELALLKAQQDSLRAELQQMRAAMATHTVALAGR